MNYRGKYSDDLESPMVAKAHMRGGSSRRFQVSQLAMQGVNGP